MYAEKFASPWTEYLNALSAPLEEAVYRRDEEEPVDLNTMDPNEAFGFAWNKAIEILQGAGHEEAACLLSAAAGDDPDDERVADQPPEEVELDLAENRNKDHVVEVGDTVKHEGLGQGVVRAIRPKSERTGGRPTAVVSWDRKGENRQPIIDNLTIVKKGEKRTYGNN
jgi:hypothetical protein